MRHAPCALITVKPTDPALSTYNSRCTIKCPAVDYIYTWKTNL